MKSIAFHLQKGGVGKTTLSGTMAFEAAKKGRTIILDCDPQGNASGWFLEPFKHELAEVLYGKIHAEDAIKSIASNLDIIPTFGLEGDLKLYGETKLMKEPYNFVDLFELLCEMGYDNVIADLSPGMGQLERAVLTACDEAVTPMTPEYFSLDGLEMFDNELKDIKRTMKRTPRHDIVVLNAFDARIKQHFEIAETLKSLQYQVLLIPVDPVFRKAQASHMSPQLFGAMKPLTEKAITSLGELLWP